MVWNKQISKRIQDNTKAFDSVSYGKLKSNLKDLAGFSKRGILLDSSGGDAVVTRLNTQQFAVTSKTKTRLVFWIINFSAFALAINHHMHNVYLLCLKII